MAESPSYTPDMDVAMNKKPCPGFVTKIDDSQERCIRCGRKAGVHTVERLMEHTAWVPPDGANMDADTKTIVVDDLKRILTDLLEVLDKDQLNILKYNRKLVIGPTETEWGIEFRLGTISIKHVSP